MNRYLITLMILSTVVMTQSMVSVTSSQTSAPGLASSAETTVPVPRQPESPVVGMPGPLTLFLLLTGLSGLVAAGSRPLRSRETAPF